MMVMEICSQNQNFNLSGSAQGFSNPEFQFLSGSDVLHDFALHLK